MKQMQAAAKWDTGMAKPESEPPVVGSAHGSAKSWSKEELIWLLGEIELNAKLKEADNRKLLWLEYALERIAKAQNDPDQRPGESTKTL